MLMNWILDALLTNIKKYETADPFEIASARHIIIRRVPLGQTYGFYLKNARQQVIHINSDMESYMHSFVCSHELCHSILHPDANTPFLDKRTLLSKAKIEFQANLWATFQMLLLRGAEVKIGQTVHQLLRENGIPDEMASLITYCNKGPFDISVDLSKKQKLLYRGRLDKYGGFPQTQVRMAISNHL
jgi:Zn-dependent peptidase ImmA (M78 family)